MPPASVAMKPARVSDTPVTAITIQLDAFARHYYECFNGRRLDDAEALVDPQALFTYPLAKEHVVGRAGYRELTRRWLAGFPDARIVITSVSVRDDHTVATDWIGEGTHLGLLELPGLPPIPPTGARTSMPMRETIAISSGRVVSSRMDFDPADLARRLGLVLPQR